MLDGRRPTNFSAGKSRNRSGTPWGHGASGPDTSTSGTVWNDRDRTPSAAGAAGTMAKSNSLACTIRLSAWL
jgi:hypothetical protein